MAPTTFTFRGDRGVVAFTELERPDGAGDVVAGGILGGDTEMVAHVRGILDGLGPNSVRVIEPNVYYTFTEHRDTVADVAAAMVAVGGGRGQLSDRGLDVLLAALRDDLAPPDGLDEDSVIY